MIFMSDVLDICYPTRKDSIVTGSVIEEYVNGFKHIYAWQQYFSPGFKRQQNCKCEIRLQSSKIF